MDVLVEQSGDWKIELAPGAGECEIPAGNMLHNEVHVRVAVLRKFASIAEL